MCNKVMFNVLAKDLNNAKELSQLSTDRILVGIMVKNFQTNNDAVAFANSYTNAGIKISIGLGAGDPKQWKRVADVAAKTLPFHINQVFPASGYTLGRMEEVRKDEYILNALIEPSDEPGQVYISTGEISAGCKDKISCKTAAKMLADVGLKSVKFYPIDGNKKLDHVRSMVRAAVNEGVRIFEPTGGIDMENVYEIVQVCLEEGAEIVIPHLYTSLIDQETGLTKPYYIKQLLDMKW